MHQLSAILLLGLALSACDDGVTIDTNCTPLYEPTFDNIYDNTLSVSCSVGNATCHTSDGQSTAGDLAFTSKDAAHAMLLDGRVEPGDAAHSLVVERIAATDSDVMPPGSPLAETEQCAIILWAEAGAER